MTVTIAFATAIAKFIKLRATPWRFFSTDSRTALVDVGIKAAFARALKICIINMNNSGDKGISNNFAFNDKDKIIIATKYIEKPN